MFDFKQKIATRSKRVPLSLCFLLPALLLFTACPLTGTDDSDDNTVAATTLLLLSAEGVQTGQTAHCHYDSFCQTFWSYQNEVCGSNLRPGPCPCENVNATCDVPAVMDGASPQQVVYYDTFNDAEQACTNSNGNYTSGNSACGQQ